ncbi:hypothetical protein Tco_1465049 [Tanacetum coccineum]
MTTTPNVYTPSLILIPLLVILTPWLANISKPTDGDEGDDTCNAELVAVLPPLEYLDGVLPPFPEVYPPLSKVLPPIAEVCPPLAEVCPPLAEVLPPLVEVEPPLAEVLPPLADVDGVMIALLMFLMDKLFDCVLMHNIVYNG